MKDVEYYQDRLESAQEGLEQALKGKETCRYWRRYSSILAVISLVMGVFNLWLLPFVPLHIYLAVWFSRIEKRWDESAVRWRQLVADWRFLEILKHSYTDEA